MTIQIHPKKIQGAWDEGYCLDVHTLESRMIGYNEYGHEIFSTTRTPLGELLFRLKYRSDTTCFDPIVETVIAFLNEQGIKVDAIVPIPPSNPKREYQPVLELSKRIADAAKIEALPDAVKKVKQTSQIKNVTGFAERSQALQDAFNVEAGKVTGKSILLFDDLYQSGATLNSVAHALKKCGAVRQLYAVTLTCTRSS